MLGDEFENFSFLLLLKLVDIFCIFYVDNEKKVFSYLKFFPQQLKKLHLQSYNNKADMPIDFLTTDSYLKVNYVRPRKYLPKVVKLS